MSINRVPLTIRTRRDRCYVTGKSGYLFQKRRPRPDYAIQKLFTHPSTPVGGMRSLCSVR